MPPKQTAIVPKAGTLRTPADVRADFDRRGITVAQWAREHGVSQWTVYDLLDGRQTGRRGMAHNVAVLLGLKSGSVNPAAPGREVAAKKRKRGD
jgi:gp16 family phage-associated protein